MTEQERKAYRRATQDVEGTLWEATPFIGTDGYAKLVCKKCKCIFPFGGTDDFQAYIPNYCPNCGKDMRAKNEDEITIK